MNKRQAKKREKLQRLGLMWELYHLPTYKEIRYRGRSFNEDWLKNYHDKKYAERLYTKNKIIK